MLNRLPRHTRQVIAYAFAGVAAAVAHYGLLIGLVELGRADPVLASLAGFALGGFVLNRWLTFHATRTHGEASWRFGLIAFGGFLLTGVLMHLFVKVAGLPYLPMQVVTTLIVMVFTFAGHKFFSFADREGA
jgi:putative flippase GtrA